jgi:GH15 family glucan-1,4-alpha-glucosidase
VIELRDGRALLIPFGEDEAVSVPRDDPQVAVAVGNDSAWLASGRIPGRTDTQQDMATRALLDLRLLTRPNGASTASWYGQWNYVWPRDAAFTAAAFDVTGHHTEARRILQFLARAQDQQGLWAARYNPDGTAVSDGRRVQLDGLGWALWATWLSHQQDRPGAAEPTSLWTMARRAADQISRSLGSDGLPPPSSDYFERSPSTEQDPRSPTLGVVAPILTGLRAATALAIERGANAEAKRWRSAAQRLSAAIDREFKPYGYPRSPIQNGNMDASVTFLAPPFAAPDPAVDEAVQTAASRLALPGGGVLPGEHWRGNPTQAWTPETAMFALAAAASGRTGAATVELDWLAAHRTSLGVLPEKVDQRGQPSSVAPLGWTAALVLLTLQTLDHPLPTPLAD